MAQVGSLGQVQVGPFAVVAATGEVRRRPYCKDCLMIGIAPGKDIAPTLVAELTLIGATYLLVVRLIAKNDAKLVARIATTVARFVAVVARTIHAVKVVFDI